MEIPLPLTTFFHEPVSSRLGFNSEHAGEQAMAVFLVDENFFDLYGVKLKEGRFPYLENRDTLAEVVLNLIQRLYFKASPLQRD